MRWFLVLFIAFASITAQVNLKVTAPELPLSVRQAVELGLGRAIWLVMRAGMISGVSLLLTWYSYKYFGFLELFVASGLTYVLAVIVGHYVFGEVLSWSRIGGVVLVTGGVGLFFVK